MRLLVCFLLTFGCSLSASADDLAGQIRRIAEDAKGRVGAAAMLLETGETVSVNGGERFPMQSVYKLPIAMAVLHQVDPPESAIDRGIERIRPIHVDKDDLVPAPSFSPLRDEYPNGVTLRLDDLIRRAISVSDNSACDVLLRVLGGPPRATAYLRMLRVEGMDIVATEREMAQDGKVQYRNFSTPDAAVRLLQLLHEGRGITRGSRELLLDAMTRTVTGPRRLKGSLPPGTIVAHKTGTSGTVNGVAAATNDIGIVDLPDGRHLAIAVFVSDSSANEATREAVIARIARAAFDHWTTAPAERAPAIFNVRLDTNKGRILLEVHRDWAPLGVDRFYALVRARYYDDNRFFRVIKDKWAQFGINGDPKVARFWRDRPIPDDPWVGQSNVRGTVAFAFAVANGRTTQVFINLRDNSATHDKEPFIVFAKVVEGMDVAVGLNAEYGESAGSGIRSGKQGPLFEGGNAWLAQNFPRLDYIVRATVVEPK